MPKGSIPRSKSGKTWDYLKNRSNIGKPFRAVKELMDDPPSLTGPIRQKDVERSFDAAGLVSAGSMAAKRPPNSVGTGARPYKVSGAKSKVKVTQPKEGSKKFIGPSQPTKAGDKKFIGPRQPPKSGDKDFIGPVNSGKKTGMDRKAKYALGATVTGVGGAALLGYGTAKKSDDKDRKKSGSEYSGYGNKTSSSSYGATKKEPSTGQRRASAAGGYGYQATDSKGGKGNRSTGTTGERLTPRTWLNGGASGYMNKYKKDYEKEHPGEKIDAKLSTEVFDELIYGSSASKNKKAKTFGSKGATAPTKSEPSTEPKGKTATPKINSAAPTSGAQNMKDKLQGRNWKGGPAKTAPAGSASDKSRVANRTAKNVVQGSAPKRDTSFQEAVRRNRSDEYLKAKLRPKKSLADLFKKR